LFYGPNVLDLFKRAAGNVDHILKGAKAGDLPVEQPTRFELLVNLKAARRSASPFRQHCSPAPTR